MHSQQILMFTMLLRLIKKKKAKKIPRKFSFYFSRNQFPSMPRKASIDSIFNVCNAQVKPIKIC